MLCDVIWWSSVGHGSVQIYSQTDYLCRGSLHLPASNGQRNTTETARLVQEEQICSCPEQTRSRSGSCSLPCKSWQLCLFSSTTTPELLLSSIQSTLTEVYFFFASDVWAKKDFSLFIIGYNSPYASIVKTHSNINNSPNTHSFRQRCNLTLRVAPSKCSFSENRPFVWCEIHSRQTSLSLREQGSI